MNESQIFRANLLDAMRAAGMNAAELSRKAGLNPRAVKDIEEDRVQSPKLSTVFKLCRALGKDPGEMLGLGPRERVKADLAAYLGRYSPEDQERILAAMQALPLQPTEGQ